MPGPLPKPNRKKHETWQGRQNQELQPNPRVDVEPWLESIEERCCEMAARWAEAVLCSPQAVRYTPGEVALVEAAALVMHRWITEGRDRKTGELGKFFDMNDKLLVTHEVRLRAHVEISDPEIQPTGVDELAAARAVRERLAE